MKSVALKGKRNYDGRETSKEKIWMRSKEHRKKEKKLWYEEK